MSPTAVIRMRLSRRTKRTVLSRFFSVSFSCTVPSPASVPFSARDRVSLRLRITGLPGITAPHTVSVSGAFAVMPLKNPSGTSRFPHVTQAKLPA